MSLDYLAVLIATLVFALITVAHLVRLFKPFKIVIADHTLPHWASYVFVVVGAYVTFVLYMLL